MSVSGGGDQPAAAAAGADAAGQAPPSGALRAAAAAAAPLLPASSTRGAGAAAFEDRAPCAAACDGLMCGPACAEARGFAAATAAATTAAPGGAHVGDAGPVFGRSGFAGGPPAPGRAPSFGKRDRAGQVAGRPPPPTAAPSPPDADASMRGEDAASEGPPRGGASQDVDMLGAVASPASIAGGAGKRARSMWAHPGAGDKRELCYAAAARRLQQAVPDGADL